jgi:internalin A
MTSLKVLYLEGNQVRDISPLAGLTSLQELYLQNNQISDIKALSGLINLEWLHLKGNRIKDISSLSNLINLRRLYLNENEIEDITPLVKNPGLSDGDCVNLKYNRLDLSAGSEDMKNIAILISQGVWVEYTPQK